MTTPLGQTTLITHTYTDTPHHARQYTASMTFTGNIDKNIILRPLLTSRRFSHQKNSQGRYSDFAPLSRHLPTLSNNDKGQWRHRRENNKGAYSCGTVGDFHSVPF